MLVSAFLAQEGIVFPSAQKAFRLFASQKFAYRRKRLSSSHAIYGVVRRFRRISHDLIALVGNKIVGAILVRREAEDMVGKHTRWKYNHVAVALPYQRKGIGTALLHAADTKILLLMKKRKINTAKVEIGVAEHEKEVAAFYIHNGFKVEGKLSSHYRHNEVVYVMGKELKI